MLNSLNTFQSYLRRILIMTTLSKPVNRRTSLTRQPLRTDYRRRGVSNPPTPSTPVEMYGKWFVVRSRGWTLILTVHPRRNVRERYEWPLFQNDLISCVHQSLMTSFHASTSHYSFLNRQRVHQYQRPPPHDSLGPPQPQETPTLTASCDVSASEPAP